MTEVGANTCDEVARCLRSLLQQRQDIVWVRFRCDGQEENCSSAKLIVMPSESWWSGLEQQSLDSEISEIEKSLGCMVQVEDERTIHPQRYEKLDQEWELLIDRDAFRRIDTEFDRQTAWRPIREAYHHSTGLQALVKFEDRGLLSAIRQESEKRFERIIDQARKADRLGPDVSGEDEWGSILNAAQEAGQRVLSLCCDMARLHLTWPPRTITDSVALLVDNRFLGTDCAVRLANWLAYVFPRKYGTETDRKRVCGLLTIRPEDLNEFCDAIDRAAVNQMERKNDSPPTEFPVFDLQAARAGLEKLKEQTKDKTEHCLISKIISDFYLRQFRVGTSLESEVDFDQHPISSLLILQHTTFDPLLPKSIAQAIYGDSSLVYNIEEALEADAPKRRYDAVWGRSQNYAPISIESLSEFVQSNRRVVIWLQNADRYEPTHLDALSSLAEGYLTDPTGQRVFVGHTCLIISGQFPIGTPREINFHGNHDELPPAEFSHLVEEQAEMRSQRYLNARIRGIFSVLVEPIWARFLQLVASNSLDEPLVVCRLPIPSIEEGPSRKRSSHQVADLSRLTHIAPGPYKFDFFVSYSWQRTDSQARKLVATLKSRGHEVYFDKEKITEKNIPMEKLVPELVYNVRSSRALLLFPIQLNEPIEKHAVVEDDELQHGRAIRAPAIGGGGTVLTEWSWQTFELLAAAHYLVVAKDRAYAVAFESLDPDFITRPYRSVEELADICKAYLDLRQQ